LSPFIQTDYPPAADQHHPSTQAVPAGVPKFADVTASPPLTTPFATADQPAPRRPGPAAVAELPPRRRGTRRWALGTAAALVPVAVAAGYLLVARHPAAPSRQVTRTPSAVVGSYISDINRQDWAAAWRLGGDNISGALGETYAQFKAGFSQTAHVKIQSLSVAGDVVHVTTQAREKTGPVQTYAITYVVERGVIVSGVQRLLSTTG